MADAFTQHMCGVVTARIGRSVEDEREELLAGKETMAGAGRHEPITLALLTVCRGTVAQPGAKLLHGTHSHGPKHAAMVRATAGHAPASGDVHLVSVTHPRVAIVPALLCGFKRPARRRVLARNATRSGGFQLDLGSMAEAVHARIAAAATVRRALLAEEGTTRAEDSAGPRSFFACTIAVASDRGHLGLAVLEDDAVHRRGIRGLMDRIAAIQDQRNGKMPARIDHGSLRPMVRSGNCCLAGTGGSDHPGVLDAPAGRVRCRTEGLPVCPVNRRAAPGKGLGIGRLKAMVSHETTQIHSDNLRLPACLRIDRGRGPGLSLDPRLHGCPRNAGRMGGPERCAPVYRHCHPLGQRARPLGLSERCQPRHVVPLRPSPGRVEGGRTGISAGMRPARSAPPLRRTGRHGPDAAVRGAVTWGRSLPAGPWPLRHRHRDDFERTSRENGVCQVAPVSTTLILACRGRHVPGMPRSERRRIA